jgi:hypothetical protein
MSAIGSIKLKIIDHLNALETAKKLGQVIVDRAGSENLFDRDLITYPVAILIPASAEGSYETNQENIYTYLFDIAVIMKSENIESDTDVEDLLETILQEFNQDFTLGGTAIGGVDPVSSTPAAVESSGKTYTVFVVTLRAKTLLNFK